MNLAGLFRGESAILKGNFLLITITWIIMFTAQPIPATYASLFYLHLGLNCFFCCWLLRRCRFQFLFSLRFMSQVSRRHRLLVLLQSQPYFSKETTLNLSKLKSIFPFFGFQSSMLGKLRLHLNGSNLCQSILHTLAQCFCH